MKALAKISLRVGLVSADTNMYSAIDSGEKVSFNQLHAKCKHRVQQKLFCPDCAQEIIDKKAEIVKGYEIQKGEYVVMTEEEVDACRKESNGVMSVFQFVEEEVDELLFDKPNYLEGGGKNQDMFNLIYQGIVENQVVGLAKMVLRQKDHFYTIKPYKGLLVAFDMHFPAEIRDPAEIEKPKTNGFDAETMKMFGQLIRKMTKPYDESLIKDDYSDSLKDMIQRKAKGEVIVDGSVAPAPKKVASLKDALAQSLAMAA